MTYLRLSAITFLFLVAPAWAKPVARVDDIWGDKKLFVQRSESSKWYLGHKEMDASLGDHLKTDAKSLATLQFFLGGRANLDVGTEIEIVSSKDIDLVSQTVTLKKGHFWAKFDKQKAPIKIQTAGGAMGIRGTELVISVDDEGLTTLSMLEGEVAVEPLLGDAYLAGPGDQLEFGPDTALIVKLADQLDQVRQSLEAELPRLSELQDALQRVQESQAQIRQAQLTIESADVVGKLDSVQARLEAMGLVPKGQGSSSKAKTSATWPRLSWPAIAGDQFAVMLLPEKGDEVLWLDQVSEPFFTYPSDAPPLAAGLYRYRVIPVDASGVPLGKAYEGTVNVVETAHLEKPE